MRSRPPQLLPIFRSQRQALLLATLFLHPGLELTLGDLAHRVGVPISSIQRDVDALVAAEILHSRSVGRARVVSGNRRRRSSSWSGREDVTRWARGEAAVERLLADGMLQQVAGTEAQGRPWLDRAERTLGAAASLTDAEPASACTLAYDAARFACMALLAHQGLRPTRRGGHPAVEEAVRTQFGDAFKPFRDLRIRRHELEYPTHPDEPVDAQEAAESVAAARTILGAAGRLLPHLRFF